MGTQLMALELSAADFGGERYAGCNEALVLTRPDVIRDIHSAYLRAGADVVETDSFTASRLKLDEYDLGAKTLEINMRAAQLAREACDAIETPQWPRFVAGSMGPTGMLVSSSDPALSKITFEQLADIYGEQARALVDGGVDLLLLETMQDLLELKAAIAGITREFARGLRRVPIQAQPTLITEGRMLLGTDIRAIVATLDALADRRDRAELLDRADADARCRAFSRRAFALLRERDSKCRLAADGSQGRDDLPRIAERTRRRTRRLRARLSRQRRRRMLRFDAGAHHARCAPRSEIAVGADARSTRASDDQEARSAMTAVALEQQPRPLIVGERINSQGSRKIKRLLLEDDYDQIMLVAREQVEERRARARRLLRADRAHR